MTISKMITFSFNRPVIGDMDNEQKKAYAKALGQEITNAIMTYLHQSEIYEDRQFWQNELHKWEIENLRNDLNYGHLREQRSDREQLDEMGWSTKPGDPKRSK